MSWVVGVKMEVGSRGSVGVVSICSMCTQTDNKYYVMSR